MRQIDVSNQYRYLEHTADLKIEALGDTLEESFANTAKAMIATMCDITQLQSKKNRTIQLTAHKITSLLFDFLNEILYLLETEGEVVFDFSKIRIQNTGKGFHLDAVAFIAPLQIQNEIKSATYNEMCIEVKRKKYVITVVLDI